MKKAMAAVLAGVLLVLSLFMIGDAGSRVSGVFTTASEKQVQVTSPTNLRSGAGTNHSVVRVLSQGSVVDVMGKIGTWYVVKTSDDTVGCLANTYVKPYTPASTPSPTPTPAPTTDATAMQKEMLGYINAARAQAGVAPLVWDQALCNGAYLKSKDMVGNNYFDHNSPTYGSPFDMMKKLGISFTIAGENIAINTSVKGAHDAFMNSTGHRENILRAQFKKVGLGFVQNGPYLYVTEWFTD